MRTGMRKPRRACTGSVMVEFALGTGVLLGMFGGTFQLGYTFLQYNRLQTAVAQGARFASVIPYDSATTTASDAFRNAVRNMVVYGSPTAGGSPVVSGLTADNVNLTITFANGVPSAMTVSISGFTINSAFQHITLSGRPRVTYAYQGIWTPV